MEYTDFYTKITLKYHIVYEDWPVANFCKPGKLGLLELRTLHKALFDGPPLFRRLSNDEWKTLNLDQLRERYNTHATTVARPLPDGPEPDDNTPALSEVTHPVGPSSLDTGTNTTQNSAPGPSDPPMDVNTTQNPAPGPSDLPADVNATQGPAPGPSDLPADANTMRNPAPRPSDLPTDQGSQPAGQYEQEHPVPPRRGGERITFGTETAPQANTGRARRADFNLTKAEWAAKKAAIAAEKKRKQAEKFAIARQAGGGKRVPNQASSTLG